MELAAQSKLLSSSMACDGGDAVVRFSSVTALNRVVVIWFLSRNHNVDDRLLW
ncbi:hypothetical protein TanjilG_02478 [Lupinus angustifolius]|uniref:Uncharacterized protein n=1 Tax=Lupinus angustifolius TaxID=3871 RepID=A0A394DEN5_LUPAN|nr:hypothetical protein TanjilG_02478 [Lupinus angustifolius]